MKKLLLSSLLFSLLFSISSNSYSQQNFYWKPQGSSTSMKIKSNYCIGSCTGAVATVFPTSVDTILFNGSCATTNAVMDTNITVGKITMTSAYTGTVSLNTGKTLTFDIGSLKGGTFSGGSATINCNSSFTIDGTAFASTSGTMTLAGDVTLKTGSFTHNSGKVVFKKASNTTTVINSSANTSRYIFYDAEFTAPSQTTQFTIKNITLEVDHKLTLSGSNQLFLNTTTSSTIEVPGNILSSNTASVGGGTVTIIVNGTGTQTINDNQGSSISGKLPNIQFNKTGGTVTLMGRIGMGGSTMWEYIAGTVNEGTSRVMCYYNNTLKNSSSGTMKFYDLEMFGLGGIHTISGTVQVADTFVTSQSADCIINGGTLKILKDIKWNNTSLTSIGNTTFKFTGTNAQAIYGAVSPQLYKMVVDKNGGQITLQKAVSVSNNLDLVNGYIITDTTNVLTLRSGATATSVSNSSFVKGPVIKIGNTSFTFPVGKGSLYKPIAITAPSLTTDAFRAEYFNTEQNVSIKKDSLTYISKCEYWMLKRTLGTSLIKVTLYWDNSTCDIVTTPSLRIAKWDGGKWNNTGPVVVTGTISSGSMQSNNSVNALSYFTIGKRSSAVYAHAGNDATISLGSSVTLGGTPAATGGISPFTYQWVTSYALDNASVSNPHAIPFSTIQYYLRVTDADGSIGFDTVKVTVTGFDIKSVKRFPLLAQGNISSSNCIINVEGAVGSGSSVDSVYASDSILINTSIVNLALRHADTARTKISQLSATSISAILNSQTYSSGIYRITGNATLTDTLKLQGDINSYFIFDINGSLSVTSGTIKLIGINFNQVYFRVRDDITTSGTSALNGIFLSGGNANISSFNGNFTLATVGYIAISACGFYFIAILNPNLAPQSRKCEDYLGNNGENITKGDIGLGTGKGVDAGPPTKAPAMHPDLVRYPGGSISNWWNWRTGWFRGYNNPLYNTSYNPYTFTTASSSGDARTFYDPFPLPDFAQDGLPWDNNSASPLPNTLQDLRFLTDGTAAIPIFALNLVTSDSGTQVGELFKAHCLGLAVRYAELGNEFYLDGMETNIRFETGTDNYAKSAHGWSTLIKKYFPGIKTAAVAATTKLSPPSERRNEWNNHLFVNGYMDNIDALTFHVYPPTGLDKSIPGISSENLDDYDLVTLWNTVLPIVFSEPFVAFQDLEAYDPVNDLQEQFKLLTDYNKEGWITEFNLDDGTYNLAGRWAHSLFVAAMALRFLNDTQITHVTFHTMIADATKGGLFEDDNGFGSSGPATVKYALAASGAGIRYIGLAAKNARTAREITVPGATQNKDKDGNYYPGVYGWMFSSTADENQEYSITDSNIAVILNLTGASTFIYTSGLYPCGGQYVQATQDPGYTTSLNPLGFITGHSGEIKETTASLGASPSSFIILPAYSITLIKNSLDNLPFTYQLTPNIQVSNTSVCPGDSVTLYLSGGTEYFINPAPASITYNKPTATAILKPGATTTYSVGATGSAFASGLSIDLQIQVGMAPAYTVNSPSTICPGNAVTLSESGAASGSKFNWYPSVDMYVPSSNPLVHTSEGTSVEVHPQTTTTYVVNGTDGKCYCNEQTVTASVYPKADAGPDVYVCLRNQDDNHPQLGGTISYPSQTLVWSGAHSPYLNSTTTANPKFTPPTSSSGDYTYSLTATPPGCTATTDQVTVHVLDCCTGSNAYYPFSNDYLQTGQSGSNYLTAYDLVEFLNGTYTYFTTNGISLDDVAEIKNYSNTITINGLFLINLNLTLDNCSNISFGPGAKIIIEPNCQLTVSNGTQLKGACSGMWDGIDIEGNLRNDDGLIINKSGSSSSPIIKDATTAIFSTKDSRMVINSATFQNNNQQLHLEDYRFGFDASVTSNTFSGSSNAGSAIYLEGISTFIFGDPSNLSLANTINSASIGIEAINSNVQSYGTVINMSSSNPVSTYGIKIIGGDGSKVNNNTIGYGSSVTNYTSGTTGLYLENATDFDVEQNEMDGVNKGLTLSGSEIDGDAPIFCNRFFKNHYGFALSNLANAGNIGSSQKFSSNSWEPASFYDGTNAWQTYSSSSNGGLTRIYYPHSGSPCDNSIYINSYNYYTGGTVDQYQIKGREANSTATSECSMSCREEEPFDENFGSQTFKIYPNPADKSFIIELLQPYDSEIVLLGYDLLGTIVLKTTIPAGQRSLRVNTQSIASGCLAINISSNNPLKTAKILIIH
ncbi:MAG: hypothetical protein H0W62_07240 [Chitinophagales bacterium]|nr:hypothetical protein [Chitinophagales bacterium]